MSKRPPDNPNDEPRQLQKVDKVLVMLQGTDRDDHLDYIKNLVPKIKKHLIKLSLERHEGITMLKELARKEIIECNKELISKLPEKLSPDASVNYAARHAVVHEKKDMWVKFLEFFTDAKSELDEIEKDLDMQLMPEDAEQEE